MPTASAVPDPRPISDPNGPVSAHEPSAQVTDAGKKLGNDWKTSPDRAVTTAADSGGLKILVADSKDAYAWRTLATLAEPGMPADTWIGNACVMDREHVAAVYAPRTFS
ncbi:hypothetical protein ACFU6S_44000, partial [Streptomyces sp. NPDC057456]|uniref:hypothetical protein n=1 Tax=Streptomyces sp. NPDC057456 TaxID=3346139 RepID=UPI00368380B5